MDRGGGSADFRAAETVGKPLGGDCTGSRGGESRA